MQKSDAFKAIKLNGYLVHFWNRYIIAAFDQGLWYCMQAVELPDEMVVVFNDCFRAWGL